MTRIIIISLIKLLLLLVTVNSYAQKWSFGPQFGFTTNPTGYTISGTLDNMVIGSNDYSDNQSIGLFVNYKLNSFFRARAEINFFTNISAFRIYDSQDTQVLGPVVKAIVVGHNTFEIPLLLRFKIPVQIPHFELGIQGGLNTHIYLRDEGSEVVFPDEPEEAEAANAIIEAVEPIKFAGTYGAYAIIYNRVDINVVYTRISDYFKDVSYNGSMHQINSSAEYLFIRIGYRFFGFKSKKKKQALENK